MALTAHTRWPRNLDGTRSEYRLARLLEQLLPDGSLGWFDLREFGQRQIDILLWVPEVGFVVVEVKGHRLDQVRWAGNGTPLFHGSTEHPVDQASAGGYQLKRRLEQAGGRPLGRWTFTAALPNIRRDEWLRARDREDLADESLAMVFEDDLSGPDLLLRVLERARLFPPRAAAPARVEPASAWPPGWVLRLLSPVPATRRADDADLRAIGEADTSRFPPGEGWRVVFRGYPGTGKTTHLLGLALQHVALGRRVLLVKSSEVVYGF